MTLHGNATASSAHRLLFGAESCTTASALSVSHLCQYPCHRAYPQGNKEDCNELIVVTLLVAAEGDLDLPKVRPHVHTRSMQAGWGPGRSSKVIFVVFFLGGGGIVTLWGGLLPLVQLGVMASCLSLVGCVHTAGTCPFRCWHPPNFRHQG